MLTVTGVRELTDPWSIYPEDYTTITGYSCLTPEGGVNHVKQFAVDLTDGTDTYVLYTVSYYDEHQGYYFDLGSSTIDHIPLVNEVIQPMRKGSVVAWHLSELPTATKPLRVVSNHWCCLVCDDGDGCYCYTPDKDKPFIQISPTLTKNKTASNV